jgi:hypothetical protein
LRKTKEKFYTQYTLLVRPAVFVLIKGKLKKARWLSIMWFNTSQIFNKVNTWRYILVSASLHSGEVVEMERNFWLLGINFEK